MKKMIETQKKKQYCRFRVKKYVLNGSQFKKSQTYQKIRGLTGSESRKIVPLKKNKKFVKKNYYLQAIRLAWIRRRRKKTVSGSGASWMMKRTGPGPDSA
jgi:hypothetical protein